MRNNITKPIFTLFVVCLTAVFTSCSKEDTIDLLAKTEVTVNLKDTDGTALSGWVVYGYDQFWWGSGSPSTSSVGVKQSVTDSNGNATFILEASDIDGEQEVYRFVVYYTLTRTNLFGEQVSSESLRKVVPVTVKKGENQTLTIQL